MVLQINKRRPSPTIPVFGIGAAEILIITLIKGFIFLLMAIYESDKTIKLALSPLPWWPKALHIADPIVGFYDT